MVSTSPFRGVLHLPNGRTSWLINGCDPITTYDTWEVSSSKYRYRVEPQKKKPPTFHYTGWLIGILIVAYYNPYIQVVPGRAGGGSFRRKKNYIAKKEFAYRMCARRPTSAMPKPCLCCERAFCCSMVVM